jgi:hypothetical protein
MLAPTGIQHSTKPIREREVNLVCHMAPKRMGRQFRVHQYICKRELIKHLVTHMVCHISNTSQTPYLHYTKKNGEFGRNIKKNGGTGQKLAIFSKQGTSLASNVT